MTEKLREKYQQSGIGRYLEHETITKRKWKIAVNFGLFVLVVLTAWSARGLVSNTRHDYARAQYAAQVAQYQNAQDRRLQCEQSVEARNDLRGVLLGIFAAIDNDRSHALVLQLREQLNTSYPARLLSDCPTVPAAPVPPPSYGGD